MKLALTLTLSPQEREQLATDIVQFERSGLQRPKETRDEILL